MMLPLVMITPMLSFIAGFIWWVCTVFGVKGTDTDMACITPGVISRHKDDRVWVAIWFMTRQYDIFSLNKVEKTKLDKYDSSYSNR